MYGRYNKTKKYATLNLFQISVVQSDPLAQLVNCEKLKKNSEMENKKTHPFVTIHCDFRRNRDKQWQWRDQILLHLLNNHPL